MNGQLDLAWVDPRLGALRRPESPGLTSGLSRAIAERLGIDVNIVRVAFVVLALASGFGLALYAWGTALTAGAEGRRPVDVYLPGFTEWRPRTQQVAVILSTLIATGLLEPLTPLPWPLGLLGVVMLWLLGRGKLQSARRWSAQPASRADGLSDADLVDRWRRAMAEAAGPPVMAAQLPVVDLYSPEPPRKPAVASQRPPQSWLSGLAILGLGLAAGVTGFVLSGSPLTAFGTGLITAAAAALLFALIVRSRRTPRPLLFLLVLAMVLAGWLAVETSVPAQTAPLPGNVLAERVVGADRTIALTEADLEGIDTIQVDVFASNLTIVLPGAPAGGTTQQRLSSVDYADPEGVPVLEGVDLVINATASNVEVEYR